MLIDRHGECYDLLNVTFSELAELYRALCREEDWFPSLCRTRLRSEIGFWIEMAMEKEMQQREKRG